VLVVDDEADARILVTALLKRYGASVAPASSAAEAMAVLNGDGSLALPDVIVSDVHMPIEDGYMLIERVRELAPEEGGEIPALALTAYERSSDRIRALTAGFQLHIPKPVEPEELAIAIASLTGRAGRGIKA
jgi:CheY-like chemotaxis protein